MHRLRTTRFLLVARLPSKCSALLYQPVKKRVRGCGEILETLPLPGDPSAGPMHRLPKISALNWLRLSLIPPGGDWRDLPQREGRTPFNDVFVLRGWESAAGAITSGNTPTSGGQSVADVRVDSRYHAGAYGVRLWTEPSGAVCGENACSNGAFSVADPRVAKAYPHTYGVLRWRSLLARVKKGEHMRGALPVADGARCVLEAHEIDWTGFRKTPTKNVAESERSTTQLKLRVEPWLLTGLAKLGDLNGLSAQQCAIGLLKTAVERFDP